MAKRPILSRKRYVRTHPDTRAALAHMLADAQRAGLTFEGEPITQEALVNASWLLLDGLDREWTIERLRPILARMESLKPGEDEPPVVVSRRVVVVDDSADRVGDRLDGRDTPADAGDDRPASEPGE